VRQAASGAMGAVVKISWINRNPRSPDAAATRGYQARGLGKAIKPAIENPSLVVIRHGVAACGR